MTINDEYCYTTTSVTLNSGQNGMYNTPTSYYTWPQTIGTGTTGGNITPIQPLFPIGGNGVTGSYGYTTIGLPYIVMELKRKEIPMAVYVSGQRVTVGLLGTAVECAYDGEHLIFSPGVLVENLGRRLTIIIEFSDEISHYNVNGFCEGIYANKMGSVKISPELISTIKKQ